MKHTFKSVDEDPESPKKKTLIKINPHSLWVNSERLIINDDPSEDLLFKSRGTGTSGQNTHCTTKSINISAPEVHQVLF